MPGVAAIIVTYNRKEKLRRCIRAVLAQDAELLPDIFIVDNNSSDGTEEEVRKLSSEVPGRIIYENLRHNSGGAGGFCYGVRKAAEAGYDYLWLMDDDCIPSETALQRLLGYAGEHRGDFGFLSSRVNWTDGSPHRMNVQRETLTRNVTDWDRDETDIVMASFVSLFIPAKVVMDIGLPIREFFIWTDDWEFTRRISRKYPCRLIASSVVTHDTGENAAADISSAKEESIDRFRYLYRNDVYLYRREGLKGFCYEAARLCLHTGRIAAGKLSLKEKCRRISILIRGTAEGLRFYPVPDRVYAPDELTEVMRGSLSDG